MSATPRSDLAWERFAKHGGAYRVFNESVSIERELIETKRKLALAEVELKAQNEKNLHTMLALGTEMEMRKAAESRVKELEGLAIGNESEGDGGRLFEVFIPTERLGGANCEGEECPTLGDAMPRKDQ